MKLRKTVISTTLFLLVTANVFGQSKELTADQIIEKMTKVYSSAKDYQETGSVFLAKDINTFKGKTWEDILLVEDFEKVENVTFNFYYQRPSHLRFEWLNKQSKATRSSSVWWDGKTVYSWGACCGEDDVFLWNKESSLKWAIEEKTPGSMDVADILYDTLSGSKSFYSFNKMKEAKLVKEETVNGNKCFVIFGMISQPFALWIDKKSFVLRRYRTTIATGSFDESVITGFMPATLGEFNHNDIRVNALVPKSKFNFKPQLRKGDIDSSNYKHKKLVVPPPPTKSKSK